MDIKKERKMKAKWVIFDRQGTNKCLSADLNKDGALDTDVVIKRTPWHGAPETERDYKFLTSMAEQYAMPNSDVEVEFPWNKWISR